MECSSSSRDSNSTPPFIEMPDAIYDEDNTTTMSHPPPVNPPDPVDPVNQDVDVKADYAAVEEDELMTSSIATQRRPSAMQQGVAALARGLSFILSIKVK